MMSSNRGPEKFGGGAPHANFRKKGKETELKILKNECSKCRTTDP